MRIYAIRKAIISALFLGCLATAPVPSGAQDVGTEDPWKFKAAIYLWGAGIDGTTRQGDQIDVSFNDILDNLNMAFMGAFEARKSKWSLAADVIYLDASADNAGTIGATAIPNNADVLVQSWVVNLQGARTVFDEKPATVDVLLGARYLDLESKLKLSVGSAGAGTTVKDSASVWDGVIGVKGNVNITEKWYLPYYLDVGTGQSDLTWQAVGGVGYRFEPVDVVLAYRYMYWDFDSDSALKDIDLSGPALGVVFKF